SPDGKLIATRLDDRSNGWLTLWEAASGRQVVSLKGHTAGNVVFGRDGKTLWAAGWASVRSWDLRTRTYGRPISGGTAGNPSALSPDGKLLAVAGGEQGEEQAVRVFETATGKQLYELGGVKNGSPFVVGFAAGGKLLVAGQEAHNLRTHDAATGKEVRRL